MSKKISAFFKSLIWLCVVVVVILLITFVSNKYVVKDQDIMKQIESVIENFNTNVLGLKDSTYVELKDENFKNEVERAKYYYYVQLDDTAKTIYMILENNVDNFKAGKEEIKLPNNLNNQMKAEQDQQKMQLAFQDAWDAFSKDKPELFYFDGNKFCLIIKAIKTVSGTSYELSIGKGENDNYFVQGFTTEDQVNIAIKEYENKKREIAKTITIENAEYTYSYEKILKVHDWIVDNVEYDSGLKQNNNADAYGALIQKQAICEGYAEAFKSMMDELEVPCVTICGSSKNVSTGKEEKHAWNYVYIGEKWYAIDTTWDDPVINTKGTNNAKLNSKYKYKYFLKGKQTMDKDHVVTGEIVENGKQFNYPDLSEFDFEK